MTSARLHAEAKLDHRRRGRCRQNAQSADRGREHGIECQERNNRRKNERHHANDGFDLGEQDSIGRDRRSRNEVRRVFPRNGEPRQPAGELTGGHDNHGDQYDKRIVSGTECNPKQQRRRQQIKNLHQRLRHQPRIAFEKRPFLVTQRASWRTAAKREYPPALPHGGIRNSGRRDRVLTETARKYGNRQAKHGGCKTENRGKGNIVPKHRARRPPECAGGIRRVSQHPVRLQRRVTREIARGKYRGNLQPDDESGPDYGRNNLGNQACAFRTNGAE